MNDRSQLVSFYSRVIADAKPSGDLEFDNDISEMVDDLFEGKDVRLYAKEGSGGHGFSAEDLAMLLKVLSMMWSTYKFINDVISWKRSENLSRELVCSKWSDEMVKAGLSKELADKLANRHVDDISAILVREGKR